MTPESSRPSTASTEGGGGKQARRRSERLSAARLSAAEIIDKVSQRKLAGSTSVESVAEEDAATVDVASRSPSSAAQATAAAAAAAAATDGQGPEASATVVPDAGGSRAPLGQSEKDFGPVVVTTSSCGNCALAETECQALRARVKSFEAQVAEMTATIAKLRQELAVKSRSQPARYLDGTPPRRRKGGAQPLLLPSMAATTTAVQHGGDQEGLVVPLGSDPAVDKPLIPPRPSSMQRKKEADEARRAAPPHLSIGLVDDDDREKNKNRVAAAASRPVSPDWNAAAGGSGSMEEAEIMAEMVEARVTQERRRHRSEVRAYKEAHASMEMQLYTLERLHRVSGQRAQRAERALGEARDQLRKRQRPDAGPATSSSPATTGAGSRRPPGIAGVKLATPAKRNKGKRDGGGGNSAAGLRSELRMVTEANNGLFSQVQSLQVMLGEAKREATRFKQQAISQVPRQLPFAEHVTIARELAAQSQGERQQQEQEQQQEQQQQRRRRQQQLRQQQRTPGASSSSFSSGRNAGGGEERGRSLSPGGRSAMSSGSGSRESSSASSGHQQHYQPEYDPEGWAKSHGKESFKAMATVDVAPPGSRRGNYVGERSSSRINGVGGASGSRFSPLRRAQTSQGRRIPRWVEAGLDGADPGASTWGQLDLCCKNAVCRFKACNQDGIHQHLGQRMDDEMSFPAVRRLRNVLRPPPEAYVVT